VYTVCISWNSKEEMLPNIMWRNKLAVAHEKPLCILAAYENIKSSCNHSRFLNKEKFK